MYTFLLIAEQYEHNFHKEEKMKVDIRHTRHWDLENKLTSRVDGYQQFTCPLEWIQSMKRGLSRLQNLLSCSREMKVFDHHCLFWDRPLWFQSSSALRPSDSLESLKIGEWQDWFLRFNVVWNYEMCARSEHQVYSLSLQLIVQDLRAFSLITTALILSWPLPQTQAMLSPLTRILKL